MPGMGGGNGFRGGSYRWRDAVGGEGAISGGGAVYVADLNADITTTIGAPLNLRNVVIRTSDWDTKAITLFARINGGAWFQVTGVSASVRMQLAPERYPIATDITDHVDQVQDGDWPWNGSADNNAATGGADQAVNLWNGTGGGGGTELDHEWTLALLSPLVPGDYVDLRCRMVGNVFSNGYAHTPRVTVVATVPTIVEPAQEKVAVGTTYKKRIRVATTSGGAAELSLISAPDGATLTDGLIVWTPMVTQVGFASFAVMAIDAAGGQDVVTWETTIEPARAVARVAPRQYLRDARAVIGVGDEQITIEGLRMVFEVTKSMRGSLPNACVLDIYNLAETTRTRIKEEGTALELYAGYGGRLELLFAGQLRRTIHERQRADWISKVYCADTHKEMQEATIAITFAAGTPALTIIRTVIRSFGVFADDPIIESLGSLPALLGSRTLSGASRAILDQLAEDYGFDWSVQDGVIEVSGRNAHFEDEAVVISPDSGMIGQPIVTDQGLRVEALLNPRIRVKRTIRVESRAAALRVAQIEMRAEAPFLHEGDYIVSEVIFSGDTWGNDWTSRVSTLPFIGDRV